MFALESQWSAGGKVVYLGAHQDVHVFKGPFKNRATGRRCTGYKLVQWDGSRGSFDYAAVHAGLDVVKAALAIATINGKDIESTVNTYFPNWPAKWRAGDGHENVVELYRGMK
jgi:hypothetical protein